MKWSSLLLAVVLGTPAAVMHIRHKAPRASAILFALAAVCILAGLPSLLAYLHHPISTGWILLAVVIAAIVSGMFFYYDVIRGEHKKSLFGKGGGAAGAAGSGGGKSHHARPLAACLGLVVTGLLVVFNWAAIWSGTSHGITQTVSTIQQA